jgi:hypothetical protein
MTMQLKDMRKLGVYEGAYWGGLVGVYTDWHISTTLILIFDIYVT